MAAFIAEPVQGAGGVIVPPAGYFDGDPGGAAPVRRPADRRRGDHRLRPPRRAGSAARCFGIEPDLITVAKGITSGYVPLSGCLVSEQGLARARRRERGQPASSATATPTRAHPLAAAAAMANLDLIERRRAGRPGREPRRVPARAAAARRSPTIRSWARSAATALIGARRVRRRPDAARRSSTRSARSRRASPAAASSSGVITRALPASDSISFAPPFVDHRGRARGDGRDRPPAVDEVAAELRSEGTLS